MEFMIGGIIMFAGNFAPRGWAFCDGQLVPISQNTALFSIIGTMYGGDGQTTFALPDLRGRTPIGAGSGPGLSSFMPGQKGGAAASTLPLHSHIIKPINAKADLTTQDTNTGVNPGVEVKVADTDGDNVKAKGNAIGFKATDSSADQVKIYKKNPAFTNGNTLGGVVLTGNAGVIGNTESTGVIESSSSNMQPYQAVNFIICLEGTFPA